MIIEKKQQKKLKDYEKHVQTKRYLLIDTSLKIYLIIL